MSLDAHAPSSLSDDRKSSRLPHASWKCKVAGLFFVLGWYGNTCLREEQGCWSAHTHRHPCTLLRASMCAVGFDPSLCHQDCQHQLISVKSNVIAVWETYVNPALMPGGNSSLQAATVWIEEAKTNAMDAQGTSILECNGTESTEFTCVSDILDNCKSSIESIIIFRSYGHQDFAQGFQAARHFCSLMTSVNPCAQTSMPMPMLLMDAHKSSNQQLDGHNLSGHQNQTALTAEEQDLIGLHVHHSMIVFAGQRLLHNGTLNKTQREHVSGVVRHLESHIKAWDLNISQLLKRDQVNPQVMPISLIGLPTDLIDMGIGYAFSHVKKTSEMVSKVRDLALAYPRVAAGLGVGALVVGIVVVSVDAWHEDRVWSSDERHEFEGHMTAVMSESQFIVDQFFSIGGATQASFGEIKANLQSLLYPGGMVDLLLKNVKNAYHDAYTIRKGYDDSIFCFGCTTPPTRDEVQQLQQLKLGSQRLKPRMMALNLCFYTEQNHLIGNNCETHWVFQEIHGLHTDWKHQSCNFVKTGNEVANTMKLSVRFPNVSYCNDTTGTVSMMLPASPNANTAGSGAFLVWPVLMGASTVLMAFSVHALTRRSRGVHRRGLDAVLIPLSAQE